MATKKLLVYGISFAAALIFINAVSGILGVEASGAILGIAIPLVVIAHITFLWLLLQPIAGLLSKIKSALLFSLAAFSLYAVWIVAIFPVVFPNYYDEAARQLETTLLEGGDETLTSEEREAVQSTVDAASNPVVTALIEFFTLVVMSGVYAIIIGLIQKSTNSKDKEILGNSDSVFDS